MKSLQSADTMSNEYDKAEIRSIGLYIPSSKDIKLSSTSPPPKKNGLVVIYTI